MDESSPSAPDEPDPTEFGSIRDVGSKVHETTATHEVKNGGKKEKGRVRFNSRAEATLLPATPSPLSPSIEIHDSATASNVRSSPTRGMAYNPFASTSDSRESALVEPEKAMSAVKARERARQMAEHVKATSPTYPPNVAVDSDAETTTTEPSSPFTIPMQQLRQRNAYIGASDEEALHGFKSKMSDEAFHLVRGHTRINRPESSPPDDSQPAPVLKRARTFREVNDGQYDGVYHVPKPEKYQDSVLSQLLKLYKTGDNSANGRSRNSWMSLTGDQTPASESEIATPSRKKWYEQDKSQETLANLIEASARLANPGSPAGEKETRKRHKRTTSATLISTLRHNNELNITKGIAETLSRQKFLIKLCRALMSFGAPTHRLEEYLRMAARFLEIDGSFLYLPGCMMISFDDKSTRTTEVKIIREAQGIDLGKLSDLHTVYKEVLHDVIDVEEGTKRLEELLAKKVKFHPWIRVFIFGLTSVATAPFAFGGRLIDLPLSFFLGCIVGFLQLIVSPRSELYGNIFEISATVLVTFLARAFGSIRGGSLFCFSALAQSGIAMLLPGYLVLSSALEIQSHAIIPGSIRLVYAIIYSLLLGFGITVGAALYGVIDDNAVSSTTCDGGVPGLYGFIFVPIFVWCICILYQAKWRQMPVMIVVAFAGYVVNYFSNIQFSASPQVASTLGAFAVGVIANLYSRIRHGVAAALLIPAIFAQVPGSLASRGGLLSGLYTANQLTNSTSTVAADSSFDSVVFTLAASMIQIAIGIAVGLFFSALIIYPLGKRRSGLFSF